MDKKISKLTKKHSKISNDFLIKYKIVDKKEQFKPYLMNGFKVIGWCDPFPDDDKFIKGSVDDEVFLIAKTVDHKVYPDQRYFEGNSPMPIYIPKKEIMLKIMRACICVKKVNDLWCFKEGKKIK